MGATSRQERWSASEALLLLLIASLPLMNPPVAYPIILTDCIFVVLLLVLAAEILSGRRSLRWRRGYWPLLFYALAFAPSLLATPDLRTSVVKFASEFYLCALAAVTCLIVDSETRMQRAACAWLAATAVVALVAIASLAAFVTGSAPWLLDYSRFHFGTLPPGPYPRLEMTFLNANMACNYLTVSLGLLIVASVRGWISQPIFWILSAGTLIAAASTISPGLGGIALLLGLWIWLRAGRRVGAVGLVAGLTAAAAFVAALALTPILHPTAPFLIHLPGGLVLAPAGRFLTWSAAWAEFARHPLIGHGIGIDAVHVRYLDPSGGLQLLTDAHNMFLNVAAQAGLFGLIGLMLLIAYAVRLTGPFQRGVGPALLLGITWLDAVVYQGLGGSFEDARHLWVLFGLLMTAADRDRLTRADENNRRAGAPSPC